MTSPNFSTSVEAQQAAALLESYQFELGGHDARQWVSLWLEFYRPAWIRDAVVEALYQGRYKSVSVRQILELWTRRGQPVRHVSHEFEAAVCREFGEVKLVAPQTQTRKSSIRRSDRSRKRSQAKLASGSQPAPSIRTAIQKAGQAAMSDRTTAVSFDLSTPPGIEPAEPQLESIEPLGFTDSNGQNSNGQNSNGQNSNDRSEPYVSGVSPSENRPSVPAGDSYQGLNNGNESYRRVSRSAIQSPAETEALLRTQQQLSGVLYTSARAIQPFKPALPFSAQTLRLARQKALA